MNVSHAGFDGRIMKPDQCFLNLSSHQPIKDAPLAIGSKTLLVAASQARNNARIIVTGSVDMLGDKALTSQVSPRGGNSGPAGNQAFLEALIDWAFGGKGQLVIDNVLYRVVDGEDNPPALRVKDRLEYRVSISEKVGALWIPYTYDGVQLEFVMLDPWIRTVLKPDGRGNLSASFQVGARVSVC